MREGGKGSCGWLLRSRYLRNPALLPPVLLRRVEYINDEITGINKVMMDEDEMPREGSVRMRCGE